MRANHRLFFLLLLAGGWIGLAAAPAQDRSPEAVFDRTQQAAEQGVDTHFGRGWLGRWAEPLDRYREHLNDSTDLNVLTLYSPLWQVGSFGGSDNHTFNHSFNLYAEWKQILDHPVLGEGNIYVYFLHEVEFLGTTAQQYAGAMGTTILPNDDVGEAFHSLGMLAWEQVLLDGALEVTVGQLDPNLIVDQNEYAGWDRESFLAQPLSSNSVRPSFLPALGVDVALRVTDRLTLAGIVMDADPLGTYPDFKSFGRHFQYFAAVEVSPQIGDLPRGTYRFTYNYLERNAYGPQSEAVYLSFEQPLCEHRALFFRYGASDGRYTDVEQMLSGGIVFTEAFGFNQDWLGAGVFWHEPTDAALGDEYGLETFWRLQLTERVQFTPDIQVILNPASSPARNPELTFSLRLAMLL